MSGNETNVACALRRSDEVIWDRVDGTTVLCHTGTVEFFRLNETGAFIWDLCDGLTMEDIITAVCTQYPTADRERIAVLVYDYVSTLNSEGLILTSTDACPTVTC